MKKLLSVFLSVVMLVSCVTGISFQALASGWMDDVTDIELDNTYSASMSPNDYCTNEEDGEYIDAFCFYNPSDQYVNFYLETSCKDYLYCSTGVQENYPTTIRFYSEGNYKKAEFEYTLEYYPTEDHLNTATGKYYDEAKVYLSAGTYYLTISYDAWCYYWNTYYNDGDAFNGSYDFSLNSTTDEEYDNEDDDGEYDDDEEDYEDDEYSFGWYFDGEYWYYHMGYNWAEGLTKIDGKWYYFDEYYHMVTGLKKINRYWYGFDQNGEMIRNRLYKFGKYWYGFDKKGRAVRNRLYKFGKYWYGFDKKGRAVRNRLYKFGKYWYGFDKKGRAVRNRLYKFGGYWYGFNKNGKAIRNRLYKFNGYWYGFARNGKMIRNRMYYFYIYGSWYGFARNGKMIRDQTYCFNGYWYYFAPNGVCENP